MAATYNAIINMTHISGGILPPWGGILPPLEPNWTQVASTSPSVDAPRDQTSSLPAIMFTYGQPRTPAVFHTAVPKLAASPLIYSAMN